MNRRSTPTPYVSLEIVLRGKSPLCCATCGLTARPPASESSLGTDTLKKQSAIFFHGYFLGEKKRLARLWFIEDQQRREEADGKTTNAVSISRLIARGTSLEEVVLSHTHHSPTATPRTG